MVEMMANIPVAGMIPPLQTNDGAKENILTSLKVAVRQIQSYYSISNAEEQLSINVSEIHQLCDSLDKTLFYGLRQCQEGYWPFVRDFTHSNTVKFIEALSNAPTKLQCGRAWLCLALNENSLECYFRSFRENQRHVRKHFLSLALLRDEQRMQLLMTLISGLENIPISIEIDKVCLGSGLTFFSTYFYCCTDQSWSCESSDTSQLDNFATSSQCSSQDNDCDDSEEASAESEQSSINSSNLYLQQSTPNRTASVASNQEIERITKYINMSPRNGIKSSMSDLEVIRTKVVRRVKKSPTSNRNIVADIDSVLEESTKPALSVDTADNKENRLSKATTDSGVSLASQCSSGRDSPESDQQLSSTLSFEVASFQTEFNVTFSTPIRNKTSTPEKTQISEVTPCSEERGVPEGQEDPSDNPCNSKLASSRPPVLPGNDNHNDVLDQEVSIFDLCMDHYLNRNESKTCSDAAAESISNHSLESVISDDGGDKPVAVVKSTPVDPVAEELRILAAANKDDRLDFRLDNNTLLYLLVEVYEFEDEEFFKMFYGYLNILKGNDQMVLFLLTNKCVYILKPGGDECKFVCSDCTKYSNIEYITVSLNYQGFTIISKNNHKIDLYTADEHLTRSIISNMEVAIRRLSPKVSLPGVSTDATLQLKNITNYLVFELKLLPRDICIHHIVLARWEDFDGNNSSAFTPAGPKREGFLMYKRKHKSNSSFSNTWLPGYFILNGGVLYCMNEENKAVPLFFIQMSVPHCKGCRRLHLPKRPYAFEVILSDDSSLQLAASDEQEASSWQFSFLHVVSLGGQFEDNEGSKPLSCCIIICNDSIVVAKELTLRSVKTLGKANLCDLTTIYSDPVLKNSILLEFESAEATKSFGEWIITFDAEIEKEKFLDVLNQKWFKLFQVDLTLSPVKDLALVRKLTQTYEDIASQKRQLQELCHES